MNNRKRRLRFDELQEIVNNLELIESEDESLEDPFESDDSVRDKDFQPSDSDVDTDPILESENESDIDNVESAEVRQDEVEPDEDSNIQSDEMKIVWSPVNENDFSPRKSIPTECAPIILSKLNRGSSELDCFLSLFPRSLFMFMAHCTNQRLDLHEAERCNRKLKFERTSASELMLVTGVSLVMHYNRVPTFAMYWSANPSLGNEAIKNAISRDRCQLLLSKLYFNDPRKPENATKTYYMDEVISCLKKTFSSTRTDSTYQSIDESMAKFKGRSSLKQYMPLKPIKRGVKIWTRCDSSTGYVYDMNIYCGKETNVQEGTLGERVVNKLASTITGKEVTLIFDRFFTSVHLMNTIDYASVGTCMKGRKDVPRFEGKLNRGESQIVSNRQGTLAIRWQDTKDFIVLSNCHKPTIVKVNRKMKDGSITEIDCPEAISFYNKKMGGVDLADQMTSLYDINRKSQKWWRKVYYKLLMMAVYNSFVVFKEVTHKQVTFIQFLVPLAEGLIAEGRKGTKRKRTRKVGRHSKSYEHTTNVGDHLPVQEENRRRCYSCSQKKRERRTKLRCKMCNLPLCMDCFTPFHS